MKVTNYRQTSLVRVFSRIRREARRLGSEVDSSEIVGLVPRDALSEDAVEALKLRDFGPHQILEDSIEKAIEG
jgi:glutamate formiminotransferase